MTDRVLTTLSGLDNVTLVQKDGTSLDVQIKPETGGGGGGITSLAAGANIVITNPTGPAATVAATGLAPEPIKLPFGSAGGASTQSVPAGAARGYFYIRVVTAFTGGVGTPTATLSVGGTTVANAGDADLTTPGMYEIAPLPGVENLPAGVLAVSVAGGPTTGSAIAIFFYSPTVA